MAEAWQTLEEAALTLGISSRTLHRRLARNEFQTRMSNGRREVLVVIDEPDPSLQRLAAAAGRSALSASASEAMSAPEPETSDMSASAADEATDTSHDYATTIDSAADEVQETMLALHEDRIRRTDLAIMAYQQSVTTAAADARRAVTRSRVAWSVAGVAIIAMSLGATWATHHVTKVSADVSHLSATVRQLTDVVSDKSREVQELQEDSQSAKVAAARAEGELTAAKRQVEQLIEAQRAAEARLSAQTALAAASDIPPVPATQPATRPSADAALTNIAPAAPAASTQAVRQ